ncbi:MAG TPA: nucleotidyltransferase family protein [Candidatus Pelagibacter sp.]|nr:nucleotidyltransferase family protein [Candidatus Pelagibacter sp.]
MISAILLAAGQSKRMVGENKLTKKIRGIPLIKHSVKNILASSVDELIVVLGYQKEIIEKLIDKNVKIKFVFNNNFESGMASSIKIGLNNLSEKTEAFFICLGDMPMINQDVYNQLIRSRNNKEIIVPTYKGQQGNPILFSKSMKSIIISIEGDIGAKKILEQNKDKILKVKIDDINITKDFNTKDNFNS